MQFPIFKTKIEETDKKFDLINPKELGEYFQLKAGKEIENRFDEIIKKSQSENLCIRYIHFESLREKIAS